MSSCSVVMVSYYTGPILFPLIHSVLSQPQLAELIVVDNGNMPATLAKLQAMAQGDSRLKILTGGGNVGFAKGCNEGAALATGDFLLVMHPDCILPPDALPELLIGYGEQADVRVVGALLQHPDGRVQGGHSYAPVSPLSALRLPQRSKQLSEQTHEVAYVSAACLCMLRSEFTAMGGFDPDFFMELADADLCYRVQRSGWKVALCPRVRVTRVLGASGQMPASFVCWHEVKSLSHYLRKHGSRFLSFVSSLWLVSVWLLRLIISPLQRRLAFITGKRRAMARHKFMMLACGLADLPQTRELAGKIVVVTGATSQLGLCVVRRLIAAGAGVLAISREEAVAFSHPHLRWIAGDLEQGQNLLQHYLADAVIHCAPLAHLPANIDMLADAEVRRVVAFGSASVFSHSLSANPYERDEVMQLASAESALQSACEARSLHCTLIRTTEHYGYGLDHGIGRIARIIRRFGRFVVYPPAQGRRQPVHVDDLAAAAVRIVPMSVTYGKAYNLGGGEVLTYYEMVQRIFKACGRKERIIACPALPFLLDAANRLLHKKDLSGELARRMNEDVMFFHDEPHQDFSYQPRLFLADGGSDLGGY